MSDDIRADRSTNKNYRNEDTSDQVVLKKMKPNNERYGMESTSTSTSQNQDNQSI